MNNGMKDLIEGMKKLFKQTEVLVTLGGLNKEVEIGQDCLVQLIQCVVSKDGIPHWDYHQTWVGKMTENDQKAIEGAYQGESIGDFKIIGIYSRQPGLEMLTGEK